MVAAGWSCERELNKQNDKVVDSKMLDEGSSELSQNNARARVGAATREPLQCER